MAQTNNNAGNSEGASLASRLRRIPLSWSELKEIVLSPDVNDLARLARSEEQERYYRTRRADINGEWESLYDYLLCTKFGFGWEWAEAEEEGGGYGKGNGDDDDDDAGGKKKKKKKRSKPSFREYADNQRRCEREGNCGAPELRLCMNDFPYYLAPGAEHWVLWKLGGGVVTPDEVDDAKLDLVSRSRGLVSRRYDRASFRGVANDHEVFLHWVNPPHLKSLPGIDHVHILFRSAGMSHL